MDAFTESSWWQIKIFWSSFFRFFFSPPPLIPLCGALTNTFNNMASRKMSGGSWLLTFWFDENWPTFRFRLFFGFCFLLLSPFSWPAFAPGIVLYLTPWELPSVATSGVATSQTFTVWKRIRTTVLQFLFHFHWAIDSFKELQGISELWFSLQGPGYHSLACVLLFCSVLAILPWYVRFYYSIHHSKSQDFL